MTALKALPPVQPMLALPNYSFQPAESYIEQEFVDAFLQELTEFVTKRTAELGAQKTSEMESCKRLLSAAAAKPTENVWADLLEGTSLAFNPFPLRKRYVALSDMDALQSDWMNAFSDANRVWHTIELCIPKSLKPNDEQRAPSTFTTRASQR